MQSEPDQNPAISPPARRGVVYALLGLLLLTHLVLMVSVTLNSSACYDEGAHLAAGAAYWREGEFSIYNLSPPLLRYWAAAPAYFGGATVPVAQHDRDVSANSRHWVYLDEFQAANAGHMFRYILWGRWALLPFSLATGWLIFVWSAGRYGPWAGLLSCSLWCFSPLVIAHGATLGTDMGCTLAMAATVYYWIRFLHKPTVANTFIVAGIFAVSQTMKSTALLSVPTLVLLAAIECWGRRATLKTAVVGLLYCAVIGFVVFNGIYQFKHMTDRLGDFDFQSRTLQRVRHVLPGWLIVPFHRDAVEGFDAQKLEAENFYPAVMFGQGYFGQNWRFYPSQWGMCETIGWLLLMLLTAGSFIWRRPTRGEIPVIAAAVVAMVGWIGLTGLNTSLRYVLPFYPYLAVLAGRLMANARDSLRAAEPARFPARLLPSIATVLALAMAVEAIAAAPRYHSFVNLAFRYTPFRPIGAELDWGQGLIDVARWQKRNPSLRTCLLYFGTARPQDYGVTCVDPTQADNADVLIVSKLLLNGMPERLVGGRFVLLRCWRQLRTMQPVADLDGMVVYRMEQVRRTGITPWVRDVQSWTDAWSDPTCVPFINKPHE